MNTKQNTRIRRRGHYTLGVGCTHELHTTVDVLNTCADVPVGKFEVYGLASRYQGLVMYEFLADMNDGGADYQASCRRIEETTGLKMVPSYGKWSKIWELRTDPNSGSTVGTFLARVLFAADGPGVDCILGDKARDTKMLFHLSEESEYIGKFTCMIVDCIGDGNLHARPYVAKRFGTRLTKVVGFEIADPHAVSRGESAVIKGMMRSMKAKDMPAGPSGEKVDIILPTATCKYRKMEVGTIFTVELYLAKRESDDHLYAAECVRRGVDMTAPLRKLDYQTIFRMWDCFKPEVRKQILDSVVSNLKMFYSVFTNRASLQQFLAGNVSDLESSSTLNSTAKAILWGLPVQAKEVEALIQPCAEKILPVTLPGWRFRAFPGEGLKRFEIRLPHELESSYKVGDKFTVHRSPNVGIEMVNVVVAGFSDTFEMNPDTLDYFHGGDTDGDEITVYEGHLLIHNKLVAERADLYHSKSVKAEKGRALTTREASYRAALSSMAIGFLDGEVAGVFARFPGYTVNHAIAANAVLRSVDAAKHAEVVMPTPGELTEMFRKQNVIGEKTRLAPAAIYRILNRKFETFLEFNRLVERATSELGRMKAISDIEDVAVPCLRYLYMPDQRRFKEESRSVYVLDIPKDEETRLTAYLPSLLIHRNNWEQSGIPIAKRKEGSAVCRQAKTIEALAAKYGVDKMASAMALRKEILLAYTSQYCELVRPLHHVNGKLVEKSEFQAKADRHEAHELSESIREVLTTSEDGYLTACLIWIGLGTEEYLPKVNKDKTDPTSLRIMCFIMPGQTLTDCTPVVGSDVKPGVFDVKARMDSLCSSRNWEPSIVIHQIKPSLR